MPKGYINLLGGGGSPHIVLEEEFIGGMKELSTPRRASRSVGELGWELVGSTFAQHVAAAGEPGGFMLALDIAEMNRMDLGEETVPLPDITYPEKPGALLPGETWSSYFKASFSAFASTTQYRIGFNGSLVPYQEDWSDGIYIERDFADSQWFAVCASFYTSIRVALGPTVVGDQSFFIKRTPSGVTFQVDTSPAVVITANIPTAVALVPAFWLRLDFSHVGRVTLTPRQWAIQFPSLKSAGSFLL